MVATQMVATQRSAAPMSRSGTSRSTASWDRTSSSGPRRRAAGAAPHARASWLVGAFAALLAACAVWTQAGAAGHAGDGPLAVPGGPAIPAAEHAWVVQPGDTLWEIARRVQPAGDIRPLVDELDAQTHGRPLEVGERLTLP